MPEAQLTDVFSFQFKNGSDYEIRTIQKNDGSIWFVAKDVCSVLGLLNPSTSLKPLENDERAKKSLGRQGNAWIISESGLYALALRSNKPEAKKFRKWITSEVLPEIRKTGAYNYQVALPVQELPVSDTAVIAFLQAATDTFWSVEKALQQHRVIESTLRKAKKDVSVVIRSINDAFPAAQQAVSFISGHGDRLPLEVERR